MSTPTENASLRQEIKNAESHVATLRQQIKNAEVEILSVERRRDILKSMLKGDTAAAPAAKPPTP